MTFPEFVNLLRVYYLTLPVMYELYSRMKFFLLEATQSISAFNCIA